jgi:hypothetical protein
MDPERFLSQTLFIICTEKLYCRKGIGRLISPQNGLVLRPIQTPQYPCFHFLVTPSTFRASEAAIVVLAHHTVPVTADPAFAGSRNTQHERVIRNIASDYSACSDKGVTTDRGTTDDRRVGANSGPTAYQCFLVKVLSYDFGSGVDHIGKNTRWTTEDVVFQLDTRVYRDVVLDFDIVPDYDVTRHKNVLAQDTAVTNAGLSRDVAKVPDLGPRSYVARLIDASGGMGKVSLRTHE